MVTFSVCEDCSTPIRGAACCVVCGVTRTTAAREAAFGQRMLRLFVLAQIGGLLAVCVLFARDCS